MCFSSTIKRPILSGRVDMALFIGFVSGESNVFVRYINVHIRFLHLQSFGRCLTRSSRTDGVFKKINFQKLTRVFLVLEIFLLN